MAAASGRLRLAVAVAAVAAACATPSYSACPVGLPAGLPSNAFAACREVLEQHYGPLALADAGAFRLQTNWVACDDLVGERRAAVFRQDDAGAADLGVVVEVRRLCEPLLGLPGWSAPRGDAAAERQLADQLRAALMP